MVDGLLMWAKVRNEFHELQPARLHFGRFSSSNLASDDPPGRPRLPEAMAAIPELQHPTVTSLRPRDILACFRANLWETSTQRLVSYRDAASSPVGTG